LLVHFFVIGEESGESIGGRWAFVAIFLVFWSATDYSSTIFVRERFGLDSQLDCYESIVADFLIDYNLASRFRFEFGFIEAVPTRATVH